MKKNSTGHRSRKRSAKIREESLTIGLDLGDKTSRYCVLDGGGEVVAERSVATTKKRMAQMFGAMRRCRIALANTPLQPAAEKRRC